MSVTAPSDPRALQRFVDAQEHHYADALAEIRNGRKRTHWMWFVFPQIAGLGFSAMSQRYAIESVAEARAYLEHPVLGRRLEEIAQAVLDVPGRTAVEIFGSPDDMKLRSCATLFAQISQPESIFHRLLDKYFDGEPDERTLLALRRA